VEKGQVLAVLDDYKLRSAELGRQQALVEDARVKLERLERLSRTQSTSRAKLDETRYELRALEADQKVFEERREMSLIRAPEAMQVLKIHIEPGERVAADGVMDLGQTRQMSVVAEVYETDIAKIQTGQEALIRSPALPGEVRGRVSEVAFQVGRMDVLDIDPVARTDARVVEVTITLDENSGLEALTNLQVDVEILM
jgi:HlyD family secretion protein